MTDDQTLEGMERTTKFSFTGMGYESLKVDFKRGDEVEFKVRGIVDMIGDKDLKNGPVHLVGVAVDSVAPVSFDEPEDPAVKVADGDGLFSDDEGDADEEQVG
jgi:hypothetical protein